MMIYFSPIVIDPEASLKNGEIISSLKADERIIDIRFAEDIDGALILAIDDDVDIHQFSRKYHGYVAEDKKFFLKSRKEGKRFGKTE